MHDIGWDMCTIGFVTAHALCWYTVVRVAWHRASMAQAQDCTLDAVITWSLRLKMRHRCKQYLSLTRISGDNRGRISLLVGREERAHPVRPLGAAATSTSMTSSRAPEALALRPPFLALLPLAPPAAFAFALAAWPRPAINMSPSLYITLLHGQMLQSSSWLHSETSFCVLMFRHLHRGRSTHNSTWSALTVQQ